MRGKVLFGGEPVIMNDLQAITSKEMIYYMIIGVVSIYAILSASMTSFIEPLLFLVSIRYHYSQYGNQYYKRKVSL